MTSKRRESRHRSETPPAQDDRAPNWELVDTDEGVARLAAALQGAARVYLDCEFDSSRRGQTLSLIQIGTDLDESVWVVDALSRPAGAPIDLCPLAAALGRPELSWVLHAGKQDVVLLTERLDLAAPPTVLDTQVGWSLTSAEYQVSFAHIVFHVTGKRRSKGHQSDDWLRRPLPASQLRYAADDVVPMPAIDAYLRRQLQAGAKESAWAAATAESLWPPPSPDIKLSIDRFRNAWQLSGAARAALAELIDWNNARVSERRRSLAPKSLFAVAARMPLKMDEILRLKGIPAGISRDVANELLECVQRGCIHPEDPANDAPIPYGTFDEVRVKGWLTHVTAELCATTGVAPELAFPTALLRSMESEVLGRRDWAAAGECLEGWRAEVFGPYWTRAMQGGPTL